MNLYKIQYTAEYIKQGTSVAEVLGVSTSDAHDNLITYLAERCDPYCKITIQSVTEMDWEDYEKRVLSDVMR